MQSHLENTVEPSCQSEKLISINLIAFSLIIMTQFIWQDWELNPGHNSCVHGLGSQCTNTYPEIIVKTLKLQTILNNSYPYSQSYYHTSRLYSVLCKVKYLYSASSRSASNALLLPVHWPWSPQGIPPARHSANTARPWIQASVSCEMPVYSPAFGRHSFQPTQRAGWRWVGLGAWFRTDVVYPFKDSQPPRHNRA